MGKEFSLAEIEARQVTKGPSMKAECQAGLRGMEDRAEMVEEVVGAHLVDRVVPEEIRLVALLEDVPRTTMIGKVADRLAMMDRPEATVEVDDRTGTFGLGSAIPSSTAT